MTRYGSNTDYGTLQDRMRDIGKHDHGMMGRSVGPLLGQSIHDDGMDKKV
jgi:hypothetical protein